MLPAAVVTLAAAGLFAGYLRMSRTMSIDADGASNALQAWDFFHGNVLLRGWTVTDVSFYSTELIQYGLVELVYGYRADVNHVCAAMSYTLLVIVAALVAVGRSRGREALARAGLAVAVLLVPGPQRGYVIMLGSPDHIGTGVPVLLTWLALDRLAGRRWLPVAVALLLAWGQVGDPLVFFVGALPIAAVGLWRATRRDGRPSAASGLGGRARWRGMDAQLVVAAAASVALARLALWSVRRLGGFRTHGLITHLSPPSQWPEHAWLAAKSSAQVFGAYFPELHGPADAAVGVVNVVMMAAVVAAIGTTALRAVGRGDRVAEVLALGICVNVGAFVISTLPDGMTTSRLLVITAPLGAALAGRVLGPGLSRWSLPTWSAATAVAVFLAVMFGVRAAAPVAPTTDRAVAEWLVAHHLRYGLGGYWSANNITLISGGRVEVAPVVGQDRVYGYRWESKAEWYDPARRDARFLVVDSSWVGYGSDAAARQLGSPIAEQRFGTVTVYVYDHNVLEGLGADCVGSYAPSMAECPDRGRR